MEDQFIYEKVATVLERQISKGLLRVGDRMPSLRSLCVEHGISMNTAVQTYLNLEKKGLIESRPQSGYYVTYSDEEMPDYPATTKPELTAGMEDHEDIIEAVYRNRSKGEVQLQLGFPSVNMLPVAKLNKAMMEAIRGLPDSGLVYDTRGNRRLKEQIAMRARIWKGDLDPDAILTTSGCMESIACTLLTLVNKGDTVAVESPVYFGILQLLKSLGLRVIELPTSPVTGVDPDALKQTLKRRKVKLCLLVPNFNNPLGSCMPDEHKREVVQLLDHHGVPLIEDDEYGEFHFQRKRPLNCKSFDQSGNVIWCGSFSKSLAPGYRVGWVSGGRYHKQISRTKNYHSIATNTLAQEAIARFMENNRFDHHLRKLRQTCYANSLQSLRMVSEYFPEGTRVSRPKGGFVMWVEFDKRMNTLDLYDKAIQQRISISPGKMYTLQDQYNHCIKLSYGMNWNQKVEQGMKTLGRIATRMLR